MARSKGSWDTVREGIPTLYPRLWRLCLVLSGTPDRAADLAQAVCLRALERHHQFQPGTALDSWVFRIAQRMWLNEVRSDAVRKGSGLAPVEEIDLVDPRPDPESNLFSREVLSKVMSLPEAQRVAVLLVYGEGYSYREASMILDIPIGTVMSRLAAARAKLADGIKPQEDSGL